MDWYKFSEHFVALCGCFWLFCIPFMREFRRPLKRIIIESVLVCFAFAFAYGFLFAQYGVDKYADINTSVFVLITFLYALKSIAAGLNKMLFMLCVVVHTAFFATSAAVSLLHIPFMEKMAADIWFMPFIPVRLCVYAIVGWVVHRWLSPHLRQIKSKDMKGMWLVPFMFILTLYYFTATNYYPLTNEYNKDTGNAVYSVLSLLHTALSFSIYLLLLRTLKNTGRSAQLEYDVSAMSRQLELQAEHYSMLRSHIEETKRARHDLRHHLSVIESGMTGEHEKLKRYVDEYRNSLPDDKETAFCENFAVNSILHYYAEIAKKEGIHTDIRLELPENTGVSDTDLCIVFGNCFENAIEACRRVTVGKFIKIHSKIAGKMLAITVDNSFDGIISRDGDVFLSRKRDQGGAEYERTERRVSHRRDGERRANFRREQDRALAFQRGSDRRMTYRREQDRELMSRRAGIGISSVKAVAEKYGETAKFEAKGNVFQVSVMLRSGD